MKHMEMDLDYVLHNLIGMAWGEPVHMYLDAIQVELDHYMASLSSMLGVASKHRLMASARSGIMGEPVIHIEPESMQAFVISVGKECMPLYHYSDIDKLV